MEIKFKRVGYGSGTTKPPEYATEGSACFDLKTAEDVVIKPGEVKVIRTGIVVELPPKTVMLVFPRSGISIRTKLRMPNGVGVIDSDYRGEIHILLENIAPDNPHRDYRTWDLMGNNKEDYSIPPVPPMTYSIPRGTRIVQAMVLPYEKCDWIYDKNLAKTERGDGGFGSTGTK